jgi:hypothetical protein
VVWGVDGLIRVCGFGYTRGLAGKADFLGGLKLPYGGTDKADFLERSQVNRNALWPDKTSRSIPSLNASGNQKIRTPAATSRSSQIEADRNTAVSAEGKWKSHTKSESFCSQVIGPNCPVLCWGLMDSYRGNPR